MKKQNGFVYAFFLSFLPLLFSALLFLLFSQFLTKNWMQSKHICRSELLETQRKAGKVLSELMLLNPEALKLRTHLQLAQKKLASALLFENFVLAAEAEAEIIAIQAQQARLDLKQRNLLRDGNETLSRGLQKTIQSLRQQNQKLQSYMPNDFSFQLHHVVGKSATLAVRPDLPGVAPIYLLQEPFESFQSLHISWISEFQTSAGANQKWIRNQHQKPDTCGASLKPQFGFFKPVLNEDKSLLKL